jgi:MinD superfamily P-loop ATPase
MKQITVISGKGGTGKTTLTAGLSKVAEKYVIADCDVDAADLYLLLNPKTGEKYNFYSGKGYKIDNKKCTECGKCLQVCRYEAINSNYEIDPIA